MNNLFQPSTSGVYWYPLFQPNKTVVYCYRIMHDNLGKKDSELSFQLSSLVGIINMEVYVPIFT